MGTYTPAAERHNGFIAGGNARDIVMQNAAMRGDMDPKDVSELQNRLMEWCLRDERYARRMEVDTVVLTEPQSHQDALALAQEGLPSDVRAYLKPMESLANLYRQRRPLRLIGRPRPP